MTKNEAIAKVKRIIKSNIHISYGGQFDSEKYENINENELKQDLIDFINLYWKEGIKSKP